MVSDHALVKFTKKLTSAAEYTCTCKAWRRLSCDDFAAGLADSQLCRDLSALENTFADSTAV